MINEVVYTSDTRTIFGITAFQVPKVDNRGSMGPLLLSRTRRIMIMFDVARDRLRPNCGQRPLLTAATIWLVDRQRTAMLLLVMAPARYNIDLP